MVSQLAVEIELRLHWGLKGSLPDARGKILKMIVSERGLP